MIAKKVLMTTHPTAFLQRGGGEVEIASLRENLSILGLKADLYGATSQPLSFYDTVLHYSVVPSGLQVVEEAKKSGKKIVLLPEVWWPSDAAPEDLAGSMPFFDLADTIVFRSEAERSNTFDLVELPVDRVIICPRGVNASFAEPAEKKVFSSVYGVDDYVLWTGIIEPRKNQLSAIKSLANLDIPVVFVGDYRDRKYYEACVKTAPAHFKFVPSLPPFSEMLRSAVQHCSAFIELSLEPPGISALEAGLAGRRLVLTDQDWSREHFGDDAFYSNPFSADEISATVAKALGSPPPSGLSEHIRSRHGLPSSVEPLFRALSH